MKAGLRCLLSLLFLWLALPSAAQSAATAGSADVELTPSSRQIMRVGRNQTLQELVRRVYPGQQRLWPAIESRLRELNPSAFNRYTGRLVPGSRLRLVTIRRLVPLQKLPTLRQVGWVRALQGSALALDRTGVERLLEVRSPVYEGDRIRTGPKGRLALDMLDQAKIFLKPDSTLQLTRYVLDDPQDGASASILDLIRGGLRKITGLIARRPQAVYRFRAGIMTIGVRGTEFVAKLCAAADDCRESAERNEPQARLHLVMLDGMIDLQNRDGKPAGEMVMGQYAVVDGEGRLQNRDGDPAPGLLDADEARRFSELRPRDSSLWPWLVGGALLAIGL